MAHVSDPMFLALHASKLRGFAETDTIGALLGLHRSEIAPHLDELQTAGLVMYRDGRLSGWTLTAEGRAEHIVLLSKEVEEMGHHGDFVALYDLFMDLNPPLLRACTDWQVRHLANNVPNDHSDAAYDARIVGELQSINSRVRPICSELSALAARFRGYRPRLDQAMDHLLTGNGDWFAKPLIDSFHTVWMELHEDLLMSLRLDRSGMPGSNEARPERAPM